MYYNRLRGYGRAVSSWLGPSERDCLFFGPLPRTEHRGPEAELDKRQLRLQQLFADHSYRILTYAYSRGASAVEAEDVVSETFLVCWRRMDAVPSEALPWLLGVARKVLSNQRRGQRRQEALKARIVRDLPPDGLVSDAVESAESPRATLEALARLGERDREALLLVAWDELSSRDAAKVLGCTATAFAVRAHRARKRLLKEIESIRTYRLIPEASGERGAK